MMQEMAAAEDRRYCEIKNVDALWPTRTISPLGTSWSKRAPRLSTILWHVICARDDGLGELEVPGWSYASSVAEGKADRRSAKMG